MLRELKTETIEFTDNYEDLSTDEGFQFLFYCERCDTDYLSEHQPCPSEPGEGILNGVGDLWSDATENGNGAAECEMAEAERVALRSAIAEVRDHFHECSHCGEWICDVCWNHAVLLCEKCAPSTTTLPSSST